MGQELNLTMGPLAPPSAQLVQMRRATVPPTTDQVLWTAIRASTNSIGFNQFAEFINAIIGGKRENLQSSLPFPHVESYRLLKTATEVFLQTRAGVYNNAKDSVIGRLNELITSPADPASTETQNADFEDLLAPDTYEEYISSENIRYQDQSSSEDIGDAWTSYLTPVNGDIETIPYFELIHAKLPDISISDAMTEQNQDSINLAYAIIREKLTNPLLLELLWSYWHEEGMLVQTMNAVSMRFQNVSTSDRDPLAQLELSPLRPINNLLWGYVQDEQHRLSMVRRAYEYDHHYGLRLVGKALPPMRTADSRSKFLEAFHNLLTAANSFMQDDDQTTMVADGFPVLNALKDVHMLLTQGMHNQYGDLPWTARHEMLMQQYILSRPEMREFLPSRTMVAYPEAWMDRVDAMKRLQGWNDVAINHFRDLGVFGEQLLLAIRFGAWSTIIEQQHAANWVRYWRAEIQGYIYSYRAVTGIDLATEVVDTRQSAERYLPPALHIQNRLRSSGLNRTAKRSLQQNPKALGR